MTSSQSGLLFRAFRAVKTVGPAALLGAVLSLGLAPSNSLFAAGVALTGSAALFLRCTSTGQAVACGWAFGFGYFAFGLSWLLEPFQVDADSHAWMAPFALVLMAAGLAIFWGCAFGIAQRISRGDARLISLIGCWSLAELARAYVLTGFPWAGLAQLGVGPVTFASLPWLGPYGVMIVILAVTLPLSLVVRRPGMALVSLGCGASIFFGAQRLAGPDEVILSEHVVRLVQPNAPQDEKWHPEKRWHFFERQLDFSAADGAPDLIVWPETAVPSLLNYEDSFAPAMVAAAGGVPILYGIQREEGGRYFNSAVLMDGAGQSLDIYDKIHLVPFGEYMPLSKWAARLGVFGLAARANAGYAPGDERRLLDLPIGQALALICYEGVFAQDVNAADERADLLVLITNDAWFGTKSGPQQHLVQAQMRAAEQGLAMVRVANTGISAMIDPFGQLRETIPLGQAGYIDARLPAPTSATFYSQSGDWPAFLLALGLVLISFTLSSNRSMAPVAGSPDLKGEDQ